MILLAALLATQLAPGCRRVEQAVLCELAPPVRVAPPPAKPLVAAAEKPPRHAHRHAASRASRKPEPASPPTSAEIARHVESLVDIADCTGARALLASTGSATADSTYRACVGIAVLPAPSGGDLHPVPAEAAAALGSPKTVEHPQ